MLHIRKAHIPEILHHLRPVLVTFIRELLDWHAPTVKSIYIIFI
jgi:hypothetical protein